MNSCQQLNWVSQPNNQQRRVGRVAVLPKREFAAESEQLVLPPPSIHLEYPRQFCLAHPEILSFYSTLSHKHILGFYLNPYLNTLPSHYRRLRFAHNRGPHPHLACGPLHVSRFRKNFLSPPF
jgi:hypothetical protein